ncbi:hypothetical protein CTI12_AA437140 [Artemisia annua]|uniref:Uncharacterized protein n=1 Tax=Artemisia annua TaxID=35608 RepID=A0A2U1LZ94_ARTAN|nr:hypothetical protein CTI12_AA437140 [Artemisia annua]
MSFVMDLLVCDDSYDEKTINGKLNIILIATSYFSMLVHQDLTCNTILALGHLPDYISCLEVIEVLVNALGVGSREARVPVAASSPFPRRHQTPSPFFSVGILRGHAREHIRSCKKFKDGIKKFFCKRGLKFSHQISCPSHPILCNAMLFIAKSGDTDNKHLYWLHWDRLSKPKDTGGLGFRDLHSFNLALLAKQGWRLLINRNSFWARVLKGLYFPKGHFLTACKDFISRIPISSRGAQEKLVWQYDSKGCYIVRSGYCQALTWHKSGTSDASSSTSLTVEFSRQIWFGCKPISSVFGILPSQRVTGRVVTYSPAGRFLNT